jgi:hypothetical protein
MDAIERDALAKQQADEIHRAIGRFVAAFSGAEGNVQTCIIFILNSAGLAGPRGQMISRVLIADLTAEPLRALLQSLVGEALVLTQEVADTFDDALKRYKKLIEVRNDVMHATWFVAYGAEDSVHPGLLGVDLRYRAWPAGGARWTARRCTVACSG